MWILGKGRSKLRLSTELFSVAFLAALGLSYSVLGGGCVCLGLFVCFVFEGLKHLKQEVPYGQPRTSNMVSTHQSPGIVLLCARQTKSQQCLLQGAYNGNSSALNSILQGATEHAQHREWHSLSHTTLRTELSSL